MFREVQFLCMYLSSPNFYCRKGVPRIDAFTVAVWSFKTKKHVCHDSLILSLFGDRFIQVKNKEIVDSGSLKVDGVCHIQVTAIYRSTLQLNTRHNFREVVR